MQMNSLGVDVILKDVKDHPRCKHGPTLLFERFSCGKKSGRQFYACSACRDRKDCSFFQWASDGNKKEKPREDYLPPRIQLRNSVGCKKGDFCRDCGRFLSSSESHTNHEVMESVTDEMLKRPTTLLKPLTSSKKEAQYFFTNKTINFLIETIKRLNFNKVLIIGCPTIHECIVNHEPSISSLLLDIDQRFEQFYGESCFCWYNVFNHHFFRFASSKRVYEDFLCCTGDDNILVLMDPPFGGLVDALAYTIKIINDDWRKSTPGKEVGFIPLFWIFPYFMEKRLMTNLSLTMLDYKVDYENHSLFRENKNKESGSPIRIFTNVDASQIVLPLEENYRFCELCLRYVARNNIHCELCGKCTSKDGKKYVHCDKCKKCVKSSRTHCDTCDSCLPEDHRCGQKPSLLGCHICGDLTHKRMDCPSRNKRKLMTKVRRRKRKKP